jgi:hypothetical protein
VTGTTRWRLAPPTPSRISSGGIKYVGLGQSRAEDDSERDIALSARLDWKVVSAASHVADGVRVVAAAARAGAGHGGTAVGAERYALREALNVADIVRVGRVEAVRVEIKLQHGARLALRAAGAVLREYAANEIVRNSDCARLSCSKRARRRHGGRRGVRTARTVATRGTDDNWLHGARTFVYQSELVAAVRAGTRRCRAATSGRRGGGSSVLRRGGSCLRGATSSGFFCRFRGGCLRRGAAGHRDCRRCTGGGAGTGRCTGGLAATTPS